MVKGLRIGSGSKEAAEIPIDADANKQQRAVTEIRVTKTAHRRASKVEESVIEEIVSFRRL